MEREVLGFRTYFSCDIKAARLYVSSELQITSLQNLFLHACLNCQLGDVGLI